jgi:uncharacterized membrane protein YheB (UPF0754 family)
MTPLALFDLHHAWYVYVGLPFAMALIGYVTKLVAIKMMFAPLEFRGIKEPYLGWQGQIPRHAAKMAGIAVDTITVDLLKAEELFDRLDPNELVDVIETPLREAIEDIAHEVMSQYQPGLWEGMPDVAKRRLIGRLSNSTPEIIRSIMEEIRKNVDQVFDMKHMVVSNLVRDKALLNRIFRETGAAEFRFIARSGLYFGFAIGVVQAISYAATNNHWLLPAFGLFCGATTDWLAIQMIFRPKVSKGFGFFRWQGLFHKRRDEVTESYGSLIAKDILTPSAIMESLLTGPMSDKLFELIQREVSRSVDEQAGVTKPLVVMAVGGRRYQEMKQDVAAKVIEKMPEQTKHLEGYAEEAMDLRNTIVERMKLLSTDSFENLLRPAFKDDEKIVIAVGAFLGFVFGELQSQLIVGLL